MHRGKEGGSRVSKGPRWEDRAVYRLSWWIGGGEGYVKGVASHLCQARRHQLGFPAECLWQALDRRVRLDGVSDLARLDRLCTCRLGLRGIVESEIEVRKPLYRRLTHSRA